MTGFSLLISKTALGRQQRACEQDRTMAALVGINVDRTISLTFVIGAALASVAGLMFLLYYGVIDFFIGFLAGIKAFTAAVLGGIGSLPGAMLGGLLIGLIETFWSAYFTIEYKDVAAFSILVLVLIFRPTGLLGQPEVEKSLMLVKSENLPPIFKDSFITGLITLILAVPIVGLPTINATEGLQIEPRWSVVIWMVLAVFLGRLVLNFWWHREQTSSSSSIPLNKPFLQSLQQLLKFIIPIGVLFALVLPAMPFASRYVMDVAILVITYIMLGWGLNIVVGLAGLLDLGYVAFYAIGAYSMLSWRTTLTGPFGSACHSRRSVCCHFRNTTGISCLRLRGDYLAIVTLGFGEIIRVILLNWYEFTGGPDGISGIPRPSFFGLEFKRSSEGTFSSFFGLDYVPMHRIIFCTI